MTGKRVEKLGQRRVFDGFFKLDEVVVRHERTDGTMSAPQTLLCLERGDAVAALVHDPVADRYLFVRQFRYPTLAAGPGWLLEVVAGMCDAGETPEDAVRREIAEEIGIRVARLEKIAVFYASPGGSSERVHLFLAEAAADGHTTGGGLAHEGEDIETVLLSAAELNALVASGEVVDGKTLVGIYWLQARRNA